MQMFRIAVFLALLSAVQAGVAIAMEHTDTNWFPGVDYQHNGLQDKQVTYTEEETRSLQATGGDITEVGMLTKSIEVFGFLFRVIKNVLYIQPMIENTINIPNPDNPSENLFSKFALIIQLGIWCIYGMGFYQMYSKQQLTYGY
jgi:hypothetical protein